MTLVETIASFSERELHELLKGRKILDGPFSRQVPENGGRLTRTQWYAYVAREAPREAPSKLHLKMVTKVVTADCALPRPLDVITRVSYEDGTLTLFTEKKRFFYARHLVAEPRHLIAWALRIAWVDLKRLIRGEPKRPLQTIAQAMERS